MHSPRCLTLLAVALSVLTGCPRKTVVPPDPPSGRCEVKLGDTGLFSAVGDGAAAKVIESADELIGGPYAQGTVGDYLLSNDRIRVVIQRPFRLVSPTPYGGTIIDADVKRASGPGRDTFGKLEVLYGFGRTINVKKVEVLNDGSKGGYAVIAATGDDAVVDFVNPNSVIQEYLGQGVQLVVNPDTPLPLTATTYYVLSPGETRVRMLTAFCNSGKDNVVTQVGDLFDSGGEASFFNPTGCTNGFGARNCLIDPTTWFGDQSTQVAYGYRAYTFADPTKPAASALLTIAGIAAVVAEGENQQGLLSWLNATARSRPGSFGILAGQSRQYVRDFFVGRDLADISSTLLALDHAGKSRLTVTATLADGTPAAAATIAVMTAETGRQVTALVADDAGVAKVDLPPGNYLVSTGAQGYALETPTAIAVPSNGTAAVTVKYGASRTITVNVKDPFNAGLTARVVVTCPQGPCAFQPNAYRHVQDVEDWPSTIQSVSFAAPSGQALVRVPPGQYEVMVTRGPEYSAFPDTYPLHGQPVDVTTGDATVDAVLAHVVDTSHWVSADLHVHAVNSPDSSVPNALRVMSFAAEGVDVLVSTDHDFITDYAPLVRDLGVQGQMATMIGCEVTPFDFGHQQTYPVTPHDGPAGAPFDWAGGDGPTLRLDELYAGLRARDPDTVIQMNHPRSSPGGTLTMLQVNTVTGATSAAPETFRMTPNPAATPDDTKLFSTAFDAIEAMNGTTPNYAVLNDWMTFLSRGWVKVATGVSDTHAAFSTTGGYGRTWVRVADDAIAQFSPSEFASEIKRRHAIAGNGPFITVTAKKAGGGDAPVGVGDTLSVPSGSDVELTVDVQAPDWLQFDSVELYTHSAGRESAGGVENSTWPEARIAAKKTFDPTALPLEVVPGLNGVTARRVHVTHTFTMTVPADTWFVAMVRSSSAVRTLAPLAWDTVSCTNGVCTANSGRPMAFTNAVLVDADGSGAYDEFPLIPAQPLTATKPQGRKPPAANRVPTEAEFAAFIARMVRHEH